MIIEKIGGGWSFERGGRLSKGNIWGAYCQGRCVSTQTEGGTFGHSWQLSKEAGRKEHKGRKGIQPLNEDKMFLHKLIRRSEKRKDCSRAEEGARLTPF